eukprot:2912982-Rhodomonas_salina.1
MPFVLPVRHPSQVPVSSQNPVPTSLYDSSIYQEAAFRNNNESYSSGSVKSGERFTPVRSFVVEDHRVQEEEQQELSMEVSAPVSLSDLPDHTLPAVAILLDFSESRNDRLRNSLHAEASCDSWRGQDVVSRESLDRLAQIDENFDPNVPA